MGLNIFPHELLGRLAHNVSGVDFLPTFARDQIRTVLQTIWNRQAEHEAGITFAETQLLVSVKGGEVVRGGAPLELIVEKVQQVSNLIYRTVEYLGKRPLRKRWRVPKDVQELCAPWLFQSVPGSYQFVVAIQRKAQHELFGDDAPPDVAQKLMDILRAAGEFPEKELRQTVAQDDYRKTFLEMTRNLAPTGKSFSEIEFSSAVDSSTPVVLSKAPRQQISTILTPASALLSLTPTTPAVATNEIIEITGVLRALDLDRDTIELACGDERQVIHDTGEIVDDVIGPMVNHNVVVRARRRTGGTKLVFVDIERIE